MSEHQYTSSADRFVAEAAQLFAAKGYSSTSVADIQVACGLTSGSGALYKHFRTKRALLDAVVGVHVASMREGSRTFADDVPREIPDALRFIVHGVWAAMERDRSALRVMLRDLDEFPDLLEDVWSEIRGNVYDEVTRWIEDLVAHGRADVADPQATAAVLLASLTAFRILETLIGHAPGDVDADRFAEAWVRHAAAVLGPRREQLDDVARRAAFPYGIRSDTHGGTRATRTSADRGPPSGRTESARTRRAGGHVPADLVLLRARSSLPHPRDGSQDPRRRRLRARRHAQNHVHRAALRTRPYGARPLHLPRLDPARAFAIVTLPLHLNWSEPGRAVDLRDRRQRARVYEVVLREGTEVDILTYVDGVLLVDLWPDLVLSRDIRAAWEPVIAHPSTAAA